MGIAKKIFFLGVVVIVASCSSPQNVFMEGVNMRSWEKSATIVYENTDTLSIRDINIAVRYNDNLSQSILPLKIAFQAPDAFYYEEVIDFRIGHPNTALTVTTTESLPYRTDVILEKKGAYIISIEPTLPVRGVEAVGIEFIK